MLTTLLAAPLFTLATLPPGSDSLDHAKLAAAWMKDHAIDSAVAPKDQAEMDALVRGSSVAVEIGGIRLLLPPEEAAHERVVAAFDTLLDVHELWASWGTLGEPEQKLPKDVKDARKRIDKWVGKSLSEALEAVEPGQELFATVELDDEKLEKAFEDWNAWIRASAGERVAGGARGELVLLPTRKSFVQFACFLGHVMPQLRSTYWAADIANWSALDYYSTRVSPLSYASPDASTDYTSEYAMDTKNKDGLAQHVALMGARTLIDAALGDAIDPMFTGGLANLAVIDLFDSVDTKVDGDRRSNTTQGRSVFIPASAGGKSSGGSLPPVSAESRWRAERGKEYFLRQLRAAQKAAGKRIDEKEAKHRGLMLESDGGADQFLVYTPLLHPSVASLKVEEAFFGDYAEMVRAYRVGFLHWLRDESGKGSNEEFAALLTMLSKAPAGKEAEGEAVEAGAAADARDPFSAGIVATYGVPLSASTPTEGDLEGRFLRWLAK